MIFNTWEYLVSKLNIKLRRMSILNNKNCFISGATGGLGVEISKSLVKNGCNLLLSSKK